MRKFVSIAKPKTIATHKVVFTRTNGKHGPWQISVDGGIPKQLRNLLEVEEIIKALRNTLASVDISYNGVI